ncbi:MAG: RidA family protein [Nocardioidaceae bacterium]
MNKQAVNPWTWQEPLGYSQGVVVDRPHRTLYAAGQGSLDAEGNLAEVADIAGQAARAMDNVEAVLTEAGMTLADVVRYDVHATDLAAYFGGGGHEQVATRFVRAGTTPPAGGIATQVGALALPGMAVEITVIAAC